jgi:hypothetical protein
VNALAPTLWAVVLAAAPSRAAPGPAAVIAVVAPPGTDPAVTEALSRFKGEAASVGFAVTVVPGSATTNPTAQMESAARAASAVATVAFVSGGDPHALDVWFTDRSTGKTVLGHVSVDEAGDRSSAVLAVKAVDFLRARMFDFLVARPASLTDAPAAPTSPLPRAAATADVAVPSRPLSGEPFGPGRFGVSIGVGGLRSLQGLGTTIFPLLRGAYDLTSWSSLRITLGGLGTQSRLAAMGGDATATEEVAMAEWVLTSGNARVRPTLSVGAGVHDVRAFGSAVSPYAARAASRVSFAAALSAGVCVILSRRLAIEAEAGSFLLFPEPEVLIAGLDGGRTGRPGLSAAITMKARF